MRKAILERGGSYYRDKQEGLDFVDQLYLENKPIYGLEIVKLGTKKIETTMYKTLWFTDQESVYSRAKAFIKEQMVGQWNYVEFKF